ncbi:tetratricopeptide repeat protein [Nonomuraea antimicrobica]
MTSEQLDAAMGYWKAGDLDQAAALFRQIAATGDPEASHLLAGLLYEQGDLEGSEAAHRSVIQSGDPVFGQRSAIAMGMMLVNARSGPRPTGCWRSPPTGPTSRWPRSRTPRWCWC